MSSNENAPFAVIEINDSSDDSDDTEETIQPQLAPILSRIAELSTPDELTTTSVTPEPSTDSSTSKDIPKKAHNRRKNVPAVRSVDEDLSFEVAGDRPTDSDNSSVLLSKKQRLNENQSDEALDGNISDIEMMRMVKKIAYCRVFTNYLLRQYDMLAINFSLYSNIDILQLQLNKRVDTYSAIRTSRQRLNSNKETNENAAKETPIGEL